MKIRFSVLLIMLLSGFSFGPIRPDNCTVPLYAGNTNAADTAITASPEVNANTAHSDAGEARHSLYRVMGVILVIWAGLGLYLYKIDRSVTRLEKTINER